MTTRGPGRPEIGGLIRAKIGADLRARLDEWANQRGMSRSEAIRHFITTGLAQEGTMTITLISAYPGELAGRTVIELAQLAARPAWLSRPEVAAWLDEVGHRPDNPDVLVYVLGGAEDAPEGWPRLDVEITAEEHAELREAFAEWESIDAAAHEGW